MCQKTDSVQSCDSCKYAGYLERVYPCNGCKIINPETSRTSAYTPSVTEMSKMETTTAVEMSKPLNPLTALNYGPQAKKEELPDPGAHYRYEFKGVKIDPARIAKVYGIGDGMVFTILKKALRMGRAHKDKRQDLLDIISAAQRELEMMAEDGDES